MCLIIRLKLLSISAESPLMLAVQHKLERSSRMQRAYANMHTPGSLNNAALTRPCLVNSFWTRLYRTICCIRVHRGRVINLGPAIYCSSMSVCKMDPGYIEEHHFDLMRSERTRTDAAAVRLTVPSFIGCCRA